MQQMPDFQMDDIFILPNTVDPNKFIPKPRSEYLMKRWGIGDSDKVILTIARLSKAEKYKGYDKVIMAMKDIVKEIPNIKYVIGGSGDDKERIEKLIIDPIEEKIAEVDGVEEYRSVSFSGAGSISVFKRSWPAGYLSSCGSAIGNH